MVRNSLDFMAYLGDERPANIHDEALQPFGEGRMYFSSLHQIGASPNWSNYQTEAFRELYFRNWESRLSVEQWGDATKLTIVPWYWRYTSCNGEPIPAKGFVYDGLYERTPERVFLDNLAMTIDITPDLFESGF